MQVSGRPRGDASSAAIDPTSLVAALCAILGGKRRSKEGSAPGQFYGVHSIAMASKGNVYTTETHEGKRVHRFVHKGIGAVARGY